MINGIGSYGNYMNCMQPYAMQQQRGPADMFSKIDSDESGGVSQTELETFVADITEITGESIDTEGAVTTYDADGDGELSGDELKDFLAATGMMQTAQAPTTLFDDADSDESGGISQTELETLAATIADETGTELDTTDAVTTYDTDGDGELSSEELAAYLEANGLQAPGQPMQEMAMGDMMGGPSHIGNAMNAYHMNGGMDMSRIMDMLASRGDLQSFLYDSIDFMA